MKQLESTWDRDAALLHSRLVGCVTVDDVATWQASLRVATDAIPTGTRFKLLFDLHGYEPAALDAHRAMREVIPRLLLHTGMRPAVLGLFDDAPAVTAEPTPRVRCTAFANVHHDPDKMARYEATVGTTDQRFFSDVATARAWLLAQAV